MLCYVMLYIQNGDTKNKNKFKIYKYNYLLNKILFFRFKNLLIIYIFFIYDMVINFQYF